MIDPDKFVYVQLKGIEQLKDVIHDELVSYGFDSKQILFLEPAKFANQGDYFASYVRNTKTLYVDRVGKAKTQSNEHGIIDFVQSDERVCSIDLSNHQLFF